MTPHDRILNEVPEVFNRKDLFKAAKKLGYSYTTAKKVNKNILNKARAEQEKTNKFKYDFEEDDLKEQFENGFE